MPSGNRIAINSQQQPKKRRRAESHAQRARRPVAPRGQDEPNRRAALRQANILERRQLIEPRRDQQHAADAGGSGGRERSARGNHLRRDGAQIGNNPRPHPNRGIARHEQPGRNKDLAARALAGLDAMKGQDHRRCGRKHHRDHHGRPQRQKRGRGQAHRRRGHGHAPPDPTLRQNQRPARRRHGQQHQQNEPALNGRRGEPIAGHRMRVLDRLPSGATGRRPPDPRRSPASAGAPAAIRLRRARSLRAASGTRSPPAGRWGSAAGTGR